MKTYSVSVLFANVALVVFLCALVFVRGPFNDAYIQSKFYIFVSGVIVFALAALFCPQAKYELDINAIIVGFILFCSYLIIRGLFSHITFHNLFVPSALLLFFFFRRCECHLFFALLVVSLCIVESAIGLLQLASICVNHSPFNLIGSFDNPAGMASFLVMGLPFCLLLYKQADFRKYVGIAGAYLIVIAVILLQSRTGILAMITMAAVYIFDRYRQCTLRHKKNIISIAVVCVLVLFAGLLFLKKDSALGRILIWRTTLQMIGNDPVLGKSPGSFTKHYMEYQGEYFKSHPDSQFAQFADTTKYAFNEYLQIASEYGIIGLLLFALLFLLAMKTAVANRDIVNLLLLIAILVLSCFTYPLRYPIIWVILTYSIASLSLYLQPWKILKVPSYVLKFVLAAYIIGGACVLVKDFKFEYKWHKAAQIPMLDDYEGLLNKWNGNPFFLYNYGAELNSIGKYEESLKIFGLCEKYFNSYDMQMLIADNYFMLDSLPDAEKHYIKATHMCPIKFLPFQGLLRTYIKSGDFEQARKMAESILRKKTKIPSVTVSVIKEEARLFLAEISEGPLEALE